jgi:hypothetical protein
LVCATEGLRLCREGSYEKVFVPRGWPYVDISGPRDLAELRDFVSRVKLFALPLPAAVQVLKAMAKQEGARASESVGLLAEAAGSRRQSKVRMLSQERRFVGLAPTAAD